jgi:FMN phosphatase YigB (HAD superfamily)
MKALLLDLDDTLLGNSIPQFVQAYFKALAAWVGDLVPSDRLIGELLRATKAMQSNNGERTNEEVFAATFYPALGIARNRIERVFDSFYAEAFPDLRRLTQPRPEARALIELAMGHNLQVVIATNPLFPATAIEQRLEWAGAPVTELSFDLVTSYEIMHATKSSPAYYREILERIDRRPEECMMAGDDWSWDVLQATSVGIPAFWVTKPGGRPPAGDPPLLLGHGTLADLVSWLEKAIANETTAPPADSSLT